MDDVFGRVTLTVRCFGRFALGVEGRWSAGPSSTKARQLMQYLVLRRGGIATRQTLLDALWPESGDEAAAVHRLHLAASAARAALRAITPGFDALVCVGGGYAWHARTRVDSDVARFLAGERAEDVDELRGLARLYAGELFAGEEAEWIHPYRVRCANVYVRALERIAEAAYAQGDYDESLAQGLELVAHDRAYEAAARLVMRSFAALGRPLQAKLEYVELCAYLRKRLGVSPSSETRALLALILSPGAAETGHRGSAAANA
jgi:DNA-binding SARP family transcriptional activator